MKIQQQQPKDNLREEKEKIRKWFPSLLKTKDVFLDNAGGSQLPITVVDGIRDYLIGSYVQVGADYDAAKRATATVNRARSFLSLFMNAQDLGHVIMGPSTSALVAMLADCYARAMDSKRDEVIVCESGHEANVGPWVRLERRGYKVKTWKVDPQTFESPITELESLLCDRTRIVAFLHVSNLLGNIEDIAQITKLVHAAGAKVVVDGVAFAPHRAIDVAAWGVDYYIYSLYKVYGPHMAAMFGRHDALFELEGPNHFFIDRNDIPYKFELGGVLHEGCAGILGLESYLKFLAGDGTNDPIDRRTIELAFGKMEELEHPLQEKLIDYLRSRDSVRLIGSSDTGLKRVPTVSFVHKAHPSKKIVLAANDCGLGIRYGSFYANRLTRALGLDVDDGVVRTSMVHYNTEEEINRLIELFEQVL